MSGKYQASVVVIDRVFDAASGTFGVRLELPNRGRKLPAGLRCKATFPDIEDAAAAPRRGAGLSTTKRTPPR